jgi:hypothetical protein
MSKIKKLVVFGDSWTFGDELMAPELATHPGRYNAMPENDQYRLQHGWARHVADEILTECYRVEASPQTDSIRAKQ